MRRAEPLIGRRHLLFLAAGLAPAAHAQRAEPERAKAYLGELLHTRQEVADWLAGRAYPFSKYDSELGYLHRNRTFKEGMDGSLCTYTYDPSGARHTIMYGDQPCRINTYGNSFTSCEQVNDGETWQEVLGAHLGEPVRNYGIGGYSVYIAYLRMMREEKNNPAPYIIFNIFDDDHFRNLISWQAITNGKNWKHFQPTLPYVQANPATNQFVEKKNLCPTPESLYHLCDLDWVCQSFKDDFVLKIRLAQQAPRILDAGIAPHVNYSGDDLLKTADTLYTRAAIFASTRIVDKIEEFASANRKKVLYVLSYGPHNVALKLQGKARFDQTFVDFMQARRLPYIDLLEAHTADYRQFTSSIEDYLARYYIGHYGPQGNVFCAFAIREKLVRLLDPKPAPYQPGPPGQPG